MVWFERKILIREMVWMKDFNKGNAMVWMRDFNKGKCCGLNKWFVMLFILRDLRITFFYLLVLSVVLS